MWYSNICSRWFARIGTCCDRFGRYITSRSRFCCVMRFEFNDGRWRLIFCRRSWQRDVHTALHKRTEPISLDVQCDCLKSCLLGQWIVLHSRKRTTPTHSKCRQSDNTWNGRHGCWARHRGTSPCKNAIAISVAHELRSTTSCVRRYWTSSVSNWIKKKARTLYGRYRFVYYYFHLYAKQTNLLTIFYLFFLICRKNNSGRYSTRSETFSIVSSVISSSWWYQKHTWTQRNPKWFNEFGRQFLKVQIKSTTKFLAVPIVAM